MVDDKIMIELYKAARAEVIARIGFRDTALMAYVPIIGGYFGFMVLQHFQNPPEKTDVVFSTLLLLPIPFICLTFALIVLQHHLIIGALVRFITRELGLTVPHWDASNALKGTVRRGLELRLYGQVVLFFPQNTFHFVPSHITRNIPQRHSLS